MSKESTNTQQNIATSQEDYKLFTLQVLEAGMVVANARVENFLWDHNATLMMNVKSMLKAHLP